METLKKNVDAANEISISRLINAPRELVFEVWTDPDHIKNWWGPDGFTNTIHKMEVKPGGSWEFIMHGPDGTNYKNKSIFKEVVKPERLVYEHDSTPKFAATITFEAQGNKTLLHWKMTFESAEALQNVVKTFKADEGLKQNVAKLEEYVVNGKRPFMIERIYNAPVSIVWKAITNKEEMKKWYFKELDQFKPEVGTEFEFSAGSADKQYLHQCKVTEVIENKKISYTWRYPEQGIGNSLVTFELFPEEGNKTKLKLTHAGLETFSSITNPDFAKESFAKGWEYFIGKQLKEYVEK
jgi:uncharacterized protein YndB with AHSA1/START domain